MHFAKPLLLCPLLSAAIACSDSSATAPPPALVAYVPSDALFVVATDRMDAVRARIAESAWTDFFTDERLGFGDVIDRIRASEPDEAERGVEAWSAIGDAFAELHGEAVLYIRKEPGAEPRVTALLEPGGVDDGRAFRAAFDALLATGTFDRTVESELGGVAVTTYERDDEPIAVFELDGIVAYATCASADLEAHVLEVLAHLRGEPGTTSILADGGYAEARGAGPAPIVEAYLNVQRMIASVADEPPPDDHVLRKLGLDEVDWVALRADVGAGEYAGIALAIDVPRDTVLGRALTLFGPIPKDLLERLPSDASSISLWRFDAAGLMAGVRDFLAAEEPEAAEGLETFVAETRTDFGVDLDAVVSSLTGDFATFTMDVPLEELLAEDPTLPAELDPALRKSSAWFVELSDVAVVRGAIQALAGSFGVAHGIETTELHGVPIHTETSGPLPTTWAFVEDGMVMSRQPTPVRAFVEQARLGGPSAADDEAYRRSVAAQSDCAWLSVTPTEAWLGSTLVGMQMIGALFLPLGELGLSEAAFFRSDLAALAAERFDGGTVVGVRRDGDRLEFFLETR